MVVKELVELLLTYPQDLPVAMERYSEQYMLEADEIKVKELCEARPDGWVQDARADMPKTKYLVFPGN